MHHLLTLIQSAPVPPASDTGSTQDLTWISVDASIVLIITAAIIPIVGGLLIKVGASKAVQAGVNLFLNALNSLIITATQEDGTAVFSKALLTNFAISFIISIATLYGFYKPIGADDRLKATGGVIGPSNNPE